MHPLQNGSQATVRPANKPLSGTPGYFTESGDNNVPSYPGADWFNHVIDEFQNALAALGIEFDPNNDDHLEKAFSLIKAKADDNEASSLLNKKNISALLLSKTLTSKINKVALDFFNGKQCTSILGDSISHGAYAGNLFSNGWTRLLARSLNGEYGTASYGFTPYLSLGAGSNVSIDLHSVSISAGWVNFDSENSENSVSGQFFRSSSSGSTITISLPTFMKRGRLHYVTKPGGGTFDISINGVVVNSIDTNGVLDSFSSVEFVMNDNRYGSCEIKLTTTSTGEVDFTGISYLSSNVETTCHNFSVSGRRLRYVGDDVIQAVCENSHTLIMALGHNDHGETDPSYQAAVSAKIDLLIQHANSNNVRVVVPDFCWSATSQNWLRVLLKKLADDTGGIYVDLPSYLTKDDGSPADANYLINDLKMWVDGSHPNIEGNKWLFEMIAKAMSLSCTSKEDVLALHDYAIPLQLDQSVSIENSLSTTLSSVRRSGNSLLLNFYLEKEPGGQFPAGNYIISASWPAKTDIGGVQNAAVPLVAIDGSAFIGGCVISASGQITLNITAATTFNDLIFQATVGREK
ncbi:SGNH/GDSL hydrolase family protein [Shewanella algae]|uniref:SGNH/GDSL hydrolase family protein n=1 Tax=Shewanella algae TaxID=38313 RepID=UPI0031F4F58A